MSTGDSSLHSEYKAFLERLDVTLMSGGANPLILKLLPGETRALLISLG